MIQNYLNEHQIGIACSELCKREMLQEFKPLIDRNLELPPTVLTPLQELLKAQLFPLRRMTLKERLVYKIKNWLNNRRNK